MTNFKEFRKLGMGGSDAAPIMGMSPYKTALDVYHDKIDEDPPNSDNLAKSSGKALERVILDEYERQTNTKLERNVRFVGDPSFLRANFDGLHSDVIVEAKSIQDRSTFGEAGTQRMPRYILCQVAFYAMIKDADHVDVPVLFNRYNYEMFVYHRNERFEKLLKDKVISFYKNHIEKKIPPPIRTLSDIQKYFKINEKSIEATPEIIEYDRKLREVDEKFKTIKKEKEALTIKIKIFTNGHDKLMNGNEVLRRFSERVGSLNKDNISDMEDLKNYFEIVEKYRSPSSITMRAK